MFKQDLGLVDAEMIADLLHLSGRRAYITAQIAMELLAIDLQTPTHLGDRNRVVGQKPEIPLEIGLVHLSSIRIPPLPHRKS